MKGSVKDTGNGGAPRSAPRYVLDRAGIPVRLTPTEFEVMRGVRRGRLNKEIALELGIAEATVKAHMTALMRKLNVRNRTQVAITAAQGPTQHAA